MVPAERCTVCGAERSTDRSVELCPRCGARDSRSQETLDPIRAAPHANDVTSDASDANGANGAMGGVPVTVAWSPSIATGRNPAAIGTIFGDYEIKLELG